MNWTDEEIAFRRRRYEQLHDEWTKAGMPEALKAHEAERAAEMPEIRSSIQEFLNGETGGEELRESVDSWTRGKPHFGFGGTAGAMVFNQLVKDSDPGEVDPFLRQVLSLPSDLDEAREQIDTVARYARDLRLRGSGVAIARAPFFTSWFWWILDPEQWHPSWISAERSLIDMAWLRDPWKGTNRDDQGARFFDYHMLLQQIGAPAAQADGVFSWLQLHGVLVGLDQTLSERCARADELPREPGDGLEEAWEANLINVEVVLAELKRIGTQMTPVFAEVLGRSIDRANVPGPYFVQQSKRLRNTGWVAWHIPMGESIVSVRLHVNGRGAALTVNPESNKNARGFTKGFRELLGDRVPNGCRLLGLEPTSGPYSFDPAPVDGKWTDIGVVLDPTTLTTGAEMVETLKAGAKQLAPLLDVLDTDAGKLTAAVGMEPTVKQGDDLTALYQHFVDETGYPTPDDEQQRAAGTEFRRMLRQERLGALTKVQLRKIIAGKYGYPGVQATLSTTMRDGDDEDWARLIRTIDYLLWDETDDVITRVDRVLDGDDWKIPGFKDAVTMKLLAIAHPEADTSLIYPYTGEKGKAAMLEQLDLPMPPPSGTAGERHITANRELREALDPIVPDDLWGQQRFLYWLLESAAVDGEELDESDDSDGLEEALDAASLELYLPGDFLGNLYALLAEYRQAIFYGPPGTGKTFIAQRLAEVIAPQEDQRMLVQFHPSTSYEDFVEGFRPRMGEGNQLGYQLEPGPLRRMALAAADDPTNTYVLIIDEINRANLPKVLGELLFLLEYRDRSVHPLYRPDEEFGLPKNLWLIGTMNTADRSVALIDAAMRRRFQFVEFSPDVEGENPIANVLANWVEANGELDVLPSIVDRVNNMLRAELGGDHLALGPSYFMKPGIDKAKLERIWQFQIEPLIADVFFGEPDKVNKFGLDKIWSEVTGDPES